MTIIFSDGFDSGDLKAWSQQLTSSGNVTVISSVTDPVYCGTHALKSVFTASNGYALTQVGAGGSAVYTRFFILFDSLPADGQAVYIGPQLMKITPSTEEIMNVFISRSGTTYNIAVYNDANSTTYASSSLQLSTGLWYCIELKALIGTANGEVALWLNGEQKINQTGINTGVALVGNVNVGLRYLSGMSSMTAYYDEVAIANTYIGYEVIENLTIPNTEAFKDNGKVLNVHKVGVGWATEELVVPYCYTQGDKYTPTNHSAKLWCTTVNPMDRATPIGDPVIQTNFAFRVEKDFQTFGFVGTSSDPQKQAGGGAIMMGQGFMGPGCPPIFSLTGTMLYADDDQAKSLFPGAWGTSPPTATGNRAKYFRTDLHTLFEDTPLFDSNGNRIGQEWQPRGVTGSITGSIGSYPTTNNGAYWYDSANKRLMHDTSPVAYYVTSPFYDTLFLIRSSGGTLSDPFTLANLYCGRVTAVNGALDIMGGASNGMAVLNLGENRAAFGFDGTNTALVGYGDLTLTSTGTININRPLNIGGNTGTAGQVLTSNGSGSSPTWQNASSSPVSGYSFTAGAAISANRIVAMSADNTVVTANRSNAQKQVGVAVANISSGNQGVIAYSGAVQVRAGMTLTAGMHVTTDDSGRAYQYTGHYHDKGTLTIQNANIGAHNHQAGANLLTDAQGSHSHSASGSTDAQGSHAHGFPGTAATDTQGNHSHGFPGTAATDSQGSHSHGFPGTAATDSQGSHGHYSSSGSTGISHTHGITMGSANTGSTAGHTHSYAYSVSPTQSAGGSHSHSVSIVSAGSHSHTVGGSTGSAGSHSHNVGGSTGSAGSHSHTVGGSTDSQGSHTHSVGVSVGSGGSHSHAVGGYSGDIWTGAGGIGQGSHTHSLGTGYTSSVTDEKPIGVVIVGASTDQLATILLGA
jgi:hypothetical protein